MKSNILSTLIFFLLFAVASCELLEGIDTKELTEEEITNGLKEALVVGTENSVNKVTAINGYFEDQAIKLLLPQEASDVITKLKSTSEGNKLYETVLKSTVENLILSLNRSAEDAGKKAKPIFVDAITSMSISDAMGILHGTDRAATDYLHTKTISNLTGAFSPVIKESLDKGLVENLSANYLYSTFSSSYNTIVSNDVLNLLKLSPIKETDLSVFATQKALDGLFLKVGEEETKIRKDPMARVTDLLRQVFGELDK